MGNKRGISLIALIITIIVIVILAAVVVSTSLKTPESAKFAKFMNDMGEIQQAVTLAYLDEYASEAATGVVPVQSEIYKEITRGEKTGDEIKTNLPEGIEGNEGYRIQDTTKIKGIDKLPDYGSDYYVTDKGILFLENGYTVNGNTYYNGTTSKEGGNTPGGETPENPEEPDNTIVSDGSWNGTVNTPKLTEGLVPVAWGNSYNEISPTTHDEWYNYTAQTSTTENGGTSRWANAKAVNGDNTVYFVWIPRYEYKIVSGYHTSTAGEIDIKFIPTSKTVADSGYIIHPAFTFGEEILDGIWVGKYEAAGTTSAVNIKPDVQSLREINVSTMFTAAQGVSATYGLTGDTHMMKNIEWGAAVYLGHSKYGRNGTEVTKNNSSDKYTGRAGESISASGTAAGTYKYNTAGGVLASTTGNIYGIYDMSGGAEEYVMGVYKNTIENLGFTILPESKYYDNYIEYSADYVGDAIYEISSSKNDFAWFGDFVNFIISDTSGVYPGLVRGGGSNHAGMSAGLFMCNITSGDASRDCTFRVVLAP